MSVQADFGGNDIYANAFYSGNAQPGTLSKSTSGATYIRFIVPGINFNSATTDTPVTITLPNGCSNYRVNGVQISNASHTLTTATAGFFTATGGSGTIAADQALVVTNNTANTALNTQSLTLSAAATTAFSFPTLYFRIGTPEGAAATADVTVSLQVFS